MSTVTEAPKKEEAVVLVNGLVQGCATCANCGTIGDGNTRPCTAPESNAKDADPDNTRWAINNCLRKKLRHWKLKAENVAV